jgi:tetratricopeptide (TPR) repeat protein
VREIRPRDLTDAQTQTLSQDLSAAGERVFAGDGTPGSVLFGVEFMRERYRLLGQSEPVGGRGAKGENAQRLLRAMKLLQSAGIYDDPLARVQAVAVGRFNLPDSLGALAEAVDLLEREGFVHYRLAPATSPAPGAGAISGAISGTLEPVADVYLEQAIPDYPNPGRRTTEDWPRLLAVLQETRDGDGLNSLGNAFSQLPVGYDPAQAETLRPNKDYSVAAYRAALEVYTRDAAPSDWAMTQNNLGVALRAQANLAEGEERARLLSEAVAAYRLALEVRTRDAAPTNWAATTYNLALAYRELADAARDTSSACAALRDARASLDAALPILRTDYPANVPDAESLGDQINEKLTTLGCA